MPQGIVLPPTTLFDELQTRVRESVEISDNERLPINTNPVNFLKANFRDSDHTFQLGSYHLLDKTDKVKYLYQWPFTYGEICLEYLRMCEEIAGKQLRWEPALSTNSKASIFFDGPSRGLYSYVDITSCYYSIYHTCAINLRYNQRRCIVSQGTIPFYLPGEWGMKKETRNMLFGIMRKSHGLEFRNGHFNNTKMHSKYYKPDIVAYVLDTVQAIAQEAIFIKRFPIHIWLTDAAILKTSEARNFQDFLWNEWGLSSKIKWEGPAALFASNCFQIGSRVTEQLRSFKIYNGAPINTIMPQNVPKLKKYRRLLLDV